jgi:ribosomal protein S18 acetylase RimI-like enzyme
MAWIRAADERDLDAVAAVAVSSWVSTGLALDTERSPTERRGRFAGQLAQGCRLYVAQDAEGMAGFVIFDARANYLAQLFVAPERQRQGVGRALLAQARTLMPREIWLRTPVDNRVAIAWYEREGFVREDETRHPEPPHRMMVRYRWKAG